jgi:hypothetical protein
MLARQSVGKVHLPVLVTFVGAATEVPGAAEAALEAVKCQEQQGWRQKR